VTFDELERKKEEDRIEKEKEENKELTNKKVRELKKILGKGGRRGKRKAKDKNKKNDSAYIQLMTITSTPYLAEAPESGVCKEKGLGLQEIIKKFPESSFPTVKNIVEKLVDKGILLKIPTPKEITYDYYYFHTGEGKKHAELLKISEMFKKQTEI